MAYRLIAETDCDNGPCPKFFQDDQTGDVVVQGYETDERPGYLPEGERFLRIPAEDWRLLWSRLPRA